MRRSLLLLSAFVLSCSLFFVACGAQGTVLNPGNTSGPKTIKQIGLTVQTINDPFFVAMQQGAQAEAKKIGAQVILEDANHDIGTQSNQMDDFIQKHVDLILLNAADSAGIAPAWRNGRRTQRSAKAAHVFPAMCRRKITCRSSHPTFSLGRLCIICTNCMTADPHLATAVQPWLTPLSLPSVETILTMLINELDKRSIGQHIVLVLEDYHVITAQAIHHTLSFLLDHLPPHVHLVLSTREDPPTATGPAAWTSSGS